MSINEQALAAGARAARFIEPNLYQTPHNPERYYTSVAQEILNAAMPHIRKQIAEEIKEKVPEVKQRTHWPVGTRLQGTETCQSYSRTATIRITYVSDQTILAIDEATGKESSWTLDHRDWKEAQS